MLTDDKKKGLKLAMGPTKARLGVIIGIEDNMPAYRVYDFEHRGQALKIPFAQTITHEGHYPFRDFSKWSEEEKNLPECFIPSIEAKNDPSEWRRFNFSNEEEVELDSDATPVGADDEFMFTEGCFPNAPPAHYPDGELYDLTSDEEKLPPLEEFENKHDSSSEMSETGPLKPLSPIKSPANSPSKPAISPIKPVSSSSSCSSSSGSTSSYDHPQVVH